jgi:hypothetical protein
MKFPYSVNIAPSIESGEEIVVLRPEVRIRVHGPGGVVELVALVDTGADNSIFPEELANELGVFTTPGQGPGAIGFGGQRIHLSYADVKLELQDDHSSLAWTSRVYFANVADGADTTVILGHEGFLDYFTAAFDGDDCVLELTANTLLPAE